MIRRLILLNIAFCASCLWADCVSLTLHVSDEEGRAVSNAHVTVYTQRDYLERSWTGPIKQSRTQACTDGEGNAIISFVCHHGDFSLIVCAEGYYPEDRKEMTFSASYDLDKQKVVFSEKEKLIAVVLRRIRNPITLVNTHNPIGWMIPPNVGTYAFDLERGDWVSPRGNGKVSDLVIHYDAVTNGQSYHLEGRLAFPTGGAYKLKKASSTAFKSVYLAATNAEYNSTFRFSYRNDNGNFQHNIPVERDEYLVFRTRVVRNEHGEIVTAHYGKIYGPIRTSGKLKFEDAYYNPKANDTNLEERR